MLTIATPLCLLIALRLLSSLPTPALAYDPDAELVTGHFLASDVADNVQWAATAPLALLELKGGLCKDAQERVFSGARRGIKDLVELSLQVSAVASDDIGSKLITAPVLRLHCKLLLQRVCVTLQTSRCIQGPTTLPELGHFGVSRIASGPIPVERQRTSHVKDRYEFPTRLGLSDACWSDTLVRMAKEVLMP